MPDDHKDVLERHEAYCEADRLNREEGLDDLRHGGGDQWDAAVRRQREATGRPVLTFNKFGQFINQVAGDIRQSQPAIEPVPVDSEQDPILTDIMSGLIRQIEYQSKASVAYAWGAQCAIACGIGHWQITTEYCDENTFDQDIRIKRIVDPFAVTWDSSATQIDRSDASECFVSETLTKEQFKKKFKSKALPNDFPKPSTLTGNSLLRWGNGDSEKIRIASHWYKVPVKKTIGATQDGKIIDLSKYPQDQWQFIGVVKAREVTMYDIKHRRWVSRGRTRLGWGNDPNRPRDRQ
jgi:hypothetical protein